MVAYLRRFIAKKKKTAREYKLKTNSVRTSNRFEKQENGAIQMRNGRLHGP